MELLHYTIKSGKTCILAWVSCVSQKAGVMSSNVHGAETVPGVRGVVFRGGSPSWPCGNRSTRIPNFILLFPGGSWYTYFFKWKFLASSLRTCLQVRCGLQFSKLHTLLRWGLDKTQHGVAWYPKSLNSGDRSSWAPLDAMSHLTLGRWLFLHLVPLPFIQKWWQSPLVEETKMSKDCCMQFTSFSSWATETWYGSLWSLPHSKGGGQ